MYHPTTRVLTVLELLQSHQRITGPDLAARLEVNIRTARRYITMLQDMGIPIEAERGRYGAYVLRTGFKLPPLMFTEDEALALTLGLLVARRLGLAVAAPAVEGALAKIERLLPSPLRARVQAVQETLALDIAQPGIAPARDVLVALSAAAQQCLQVWLRYRAEGGNETERVIDPYGLVYREGLWYTAAYCHLRQDLRVFRLDRVLEAELRDATFERPQNFDSAGYVIRSLATQPNIWSVEVVLQTSLEEAQRRIAPVFATLEPVPGGVALRRSVESLDWMARELVALGLPLAVRHPPELRAALRRLATEIATMAEAETVDERESANLRE